MTSIPLERLQHKEYMVELLLSAGMGGHSACNKPHLWAESAERLIGEGVRPNAAAHACFVPGRIEVLGKHTDYAGGRSLLAVPQQGVCMVAVARHDRQVHIRAVDVGDVATFRVTPQLRPTLGSWSGYPQTVARRLARNFPGYGLGADIAFASDLPIAAGMSSSSALMIATFTALVACSGLQDSERYREQVSDREDLAMYLACVENGQDFGNLAGDRGVGTFGGSEDHTAILCCESGCLKQYSFCPTQPEENYSFLPDCSFVIAASGVVAEKTGAAMDKYNRLSHLAAALAALWRRATGRDDEHLEAALNSSSDALDRLRELISCGLHPEFSSAQLTARLNHFQVESRELIPAAGAALRAGNVNGLGGLVDRSQQMASDLLGNQVPETVYLAKSARELGAAAASAFGAGFGGSVWALVADDEVPRFLQRWSDSYASQFPSTSQRSQFFATKPGPPTWCLTD